MVAIAPLNPNTLGTQINDLLGKYGIAGGLIGAQVDGLAGNPLGALTNLADAFQEAALGRGTNKFERLSGRPASPFGFVPAPHLAMPRLRPSLGRTYYQRVDLAPGSKNNAFARIFDPRRRSAAKFERLLQKSPFARAAFERLVGGKIVNDRRADGKLTIRRRLPSAVRPLPFPKMPGLHPSAFNALGVLQNMDKAILGQAGKIAQLANPFGAMLGQGLQNILRPPAQQRPGQAGSPSKSAGNDEVSKILADPSLTIEDKISLMLAAIMQKMDKDIEKQANHINELQQKSSASQTPGGAQGAQGGKGGKGGLLGTIGGIAGTAFGGPVGSILGSTVGQAAGSALSGAAGGANGASGANGANGNGSNPSVDLETQKLTRLVEKRKQMFDMLRQIIDKYNQTANGIIQSMSR